MTDKGQANLLAQRDMFINWAVYAKHKQLKQSQKPRHLEAILISGTHQTERLYLVNTFKIIFY